MFGLTTTQLILVIAVGYFLMKGGNVSVILKELWDIVNPLLKVLGVNLPDLTNLTKFQAAKETTDAPVPVIRVECHCCCCPNKEPVPPPVPELK